MLRQTICKNPGYFSAEFRGMCHELAAVLAETGFDDIRWQMPQDSGYYQPIVTARRA